MHLDLPASVSSGHFSGCGLPNIKRTTIQLGPWLDVNCANMHLPHLRCTFATSVLPAWPASLVICFVGKQSMTFLPFLQCQVRERCCLSLITITILIRTTLSTWKIPSRLDLLTFSVRRGWGRSLDPHLRSQLLRPAPPCRLGVILPSCKWVMVSWSQRVPENAECESLAGQRGPSLKLWGRDHPC